MRRFVWVLALVLSAAPVFAQDLEESLKELGMGGVFASGNLVLRDLQRGNDPVQQLKRFFSEAKFPLTGRQEKELDASIETQMKALQKSATEDDVRHANQEYMKKVNEVLTADQRTALRRYRTEQIMMRGGFPALRLILENAQAPFTTEQEMQAQTIYAEFNRQVDQMTRDPKVKPDRAALDKLENESLGKVVRLMTPAQRRALAASRQGTLAAKVKP